MTKLSKREKILLYVMCIIVLIAAIIYLAVKPAMTASTELDTSIAEAQAQQQEMMIAIAAKPSIEDQLKQAQTSLSELSGKYQKLGNTDEIDDYVTKQMQSCSLTPTSLAISDGRTATAYIKIVNVTVSATGKMSDFVSFADKISDTLGMRITSFSIADNNVTTVDGKVNEGKALTAVIEVAEYDETGSQAAETTTSEATASASASPAA